MNLLREMYENTERFVGVFVVLMAFLVFWSPILVLILSLILIVILVFRHKYLKTNSNQLNNNNKPKNRTIRQVITSDNKFGGNVRQLRTARRLLPLNSRSADNYFPNYSLDSFNANHFLRSDNIFNPLIGGQSFDSRPQSAAGVSYSQSLNRPIRESPASQSGNTPLVRVTPTVSETATREPKSRSSPVKPVTVRIAPMPENLSKINLNRLSNPKTPHFPTLGVYDVPNITPIVSTDPKTVVDALKNSLRRKREPKDLETEFEESFVSTANKKLRRDANDSIKMANGLIPSNKSTVKRQANDTTQLLYKRFKNNEILSSYSSLQSSKMNENLKNKRKLSPDSRDANEVNPKRLLIPENEPKIDLKLNISDEKQLKFSETNERDFNFKAVVDEPEEPEEETLKKSYVLPIHLHSMEDHNRDRLKARNRLNRFLNAVKEVSSPPITQSKVEELSVDVSPETSATSDIGLPSEPAAAIFTTSRVNTVVTTTLLNTPISSVLTSTKESFSPQPITHIENPIKSISTEPSQAINNPLNSVPNWPTHSTAPPVFTATPTVTPLFSVGAGGSNTRRFAQNSRLRSRQRR